MATRPDPLTKMTQLQFFFVQDIFFVLFNFICVPSPYLWTPVPLLVEGRQVGSIVGTSMLHWEVIFVANMLNTHLW